MLMSIFCPLAGHIHAVTVMKYKLQTKELMAARRTNEYGVLQQSAEKFKEVQLPPGLLAQRKAALVSTLIRELLPAT